MAPSLFQANADCVAMVAERNLGESFLDNASNLAMFHGVKSINQQFALATILAGRKLTKSFPIREEALQKLTHVRLDKEKLVSLDLCQYILALPSLTNLYLQENELKSLKGLELAKNLRFLTVAGNHITMLDGLSSLSQLMVLDVSYNNIIKINAETDLPKSLSFIDIIGNPCFTHQHGLRDYLKTSLPNLKEVDGDPLTDDDSNSEPESLEYNFQSDLNDLKSHINENNEKLTQNDNQERNQHFVNDQSSFSPRKSFTPSQLADWNGKPSPVQKIPASHTQQVRQDEGQDPQSMNSPTDERSRDVVEYHDILYKANVNAEVAIQTYYEWTIGKLDYTTMGIMERISDRVESYEDKNLPDLVDIYSKVPKSLSTSTNDIINIPDYPEVSTSPRET